MTRVVPVVRMCIGTIRIAASILLMTHLIATSLATERPEKKLDGDLLVADQVINTLSRTHTHVYSIPGDLNRQMELRGK